MSMDHTHLIAVPLADKYGAGRIGLGLGSDVGDDKSFDIIRAKDADGNIWAVSWGPNTADFVVAGEQLKLSPEALQQVVKANLDAKFPDVPVPSLATVKKFLDFGRIAFDPPGGLDEGLAEMGLTRYVGESQDV